MSKKRKRGRASNSPKKFKKKVIEVQTPLAEEVCNITNRIQEEERNIYELEKRKVRLTECLVDEILKSNDLKNLINQYCITSRELDEKCRSQENRKKDLEYKKTKLSDENQTMLAEVTDYLTIDDSDKPIGLYNSICKSPVAKCLHHNVYLSYADTKYKKCLQHRNHKPCKHLEWLPLDDDIFKPKK